MFGTFSNLIVGWVGAGVMNDSRTSVDTFHCLGYVLSREYFLTHSVHISIGQQRWGHVASLLVISQTSIQKGKILYKKNRSRGWVELEEWFFKDTLLPTKVIIGVNTFTVHTFLRYFTPTTAGSSPPQASATKQDIFPFLGLGAFPQVSHPPRFWLQPLMQGFPGFSLPGLPPGFNPFLPPSSTGGLIRK